MRIDRPRRPRDLALVDAVRRLARFHANGAPIASCPATSCGTLVKTRILSDCSSTNSGIVLAVLPAVTRSPGSTRRSVMTPSNGSKRS